MKRTLKKVGKVLAWTLGVVAVLFLIVLAEPRWVLNTKTLTWAIQKFGKTYRPQWRTFSFEVRNVNLLTKRILLKTTDFCVDEEHGAMTACFPLVDVDATIHFGSPLVSVRRLERVVVHSQDIAVDETAQPQAAAKKKQKTKSADLQVIPEPMRHMTIGLLDVRIPRASVKSSSGTTTASVAASFSEEGSTPLKADVYAVVTGTSPTVVSHYRADVLLSSDLWRLGKVTYLDLDARLRGDQGLRADVNARVRQPAKTGLRLTATAKAFASGLTVDAQARADYDESRAKATARLAVVNPQGAVRRFELPDCRFDAPLKKGQPTRADLTCPLVVVPGPFGQPKGAKPKELVGGLAMHADFGKKRRNRDHFKATLTAEIGPQTQWNDFHAGLEAKLAGRTSKLPSSLTAEHKLDVGLTVKRFQDLVSYLDGTEFAIPAPINAFKGPVMLEARTAGDTRGETQRVDYKVTTDLSSAKQALRVVVDGYVDVVGLFLTH